MASTYNLDKNKFYLVSELTELGPRGMIGANGLPGPVLQSGRFIDIDQNRVINSSLQTGTYLNIVGNILSSNLIGGINMTLIGNIINSNITSNLNINSSNIISSIGNITFVNNLNGSYEITTGGLGSSILTANNLLDIILNSNNSNNGPTLEFYKNSNSSAGSDLAGLINFAANTTLGAKHFSSIVMYSCAYPTVGNMSGNYNLVLNGLHYLHLNASNIQTNQFNVTRSTIGAYSGSLILENYSNGIVQLAFISERSADGVGISFTNYSGVNSALSRRDFGQYVQSIRSNISGFESGFTPFNVLRFGSIWEFLRLEGAISTLNNQSAIIFNNGFLDIDLVYRSVSFNRLINADAGINSVGIGIDPVSTSRLSVNGNITTTSSLTIPNIIVGTGAGTANLVIHAGNRSLTAGSLAAYLNITVNGTNRKIPLYNP